MFFPARLEGMRRGSDVIMSVMIVDAGHAFVKQMFVAGWRTARDCGLGKEARDNTMAAGGRATITRRLLGKGSGRRG